jgi:hypothetical protein
MKMKMKSDFLKIMARPLSANFVLDHEAPRLGYGETEKRVQAEVLALAQLPPQQSARRQYQAKLARCQELLPEARAWDTAEGREWHRLMNELEDYEYACERVL